MMIDDMNSVIGRINYLKKRFGLVPKHQVGLNNKSKKDFSVQLKSSLEKVKSSGNISPLEIKNIAAMIAKQEGVSSDLVNAVIKTESDFKPDAVSPKGAKGLMQLMPDVARKLGVNNIFSPLENIKGGVRLLKQLLEKYDGDYKKALAAYNAGEQAVDKNNGIPPYEETKTYIKKVLNAYQEHME